MANYKKVNKPTARKMFNHGLSIYILPCKVSERALDGNDNNWVKPVVINLQTTQLDSKYNKFDRAINEYCYYNCNAELGYYPHYYVTEEDMSSYEMCNLMC